MQNFDPIKDLIFKIDCYTCSLCLQEGGQLEVHHINPLGENFNKLEFESYKVLYDINNLVTLCRKCHIEKAHDGHGKRINEHIQNELNQITSMRPIKNFIYTTYNTICNTKIKPWIIKYIQENNNQ